jgi:hypothetical protein
MNTYVVYVTVVTILYKRGRLFRMRIGIREELNLSQEAACLWPLGLRALTKMA